MPKENKNLGGKNVKRLRLKMIYPEIPGVRKSFEDWTTVSLDPSIVIAIKHLAERKKWILKHT